MTLWYAAAVSRRQGWTTWHANPINCLKFSVLEYRGMVYWHRGMECWNIMCHAPARRCPRAYTLTQLDQSNLSILVIVATKLQAVWRATVLVRDNGGRRTCRTTWTVSTHTYRTST